MCLLLRGRVAFITRKKYLYCHVFSSLNIKVRASNSKNIHVHVSFNCCIKLNQKFIMVLSRYIVVPRDDIQVPTFLRRTGKVYGRMIYFCLKQQ